MLVLVCLHDQLEHDDDPGQRVVPVEKVQVPPSSSDDAAGAALLPEPPETHAILNNAGSSNGSSNDGEDGVGRQNLFLLCGCVGARSDAIPKSKVESDGHDDRVEYDEGPKDEDGHLTGTQGIIEWRWFRLQHLRARADRGGWILILGLR